MSPEDARRQRIEMERDLKGLINAFQGVMDVLRNQVREVQQGKTHHWNRKSGAFEEEARQSEEYGRWNKESASFRMRQELLKELSVLIEGLDAKLGALDCKIGDEFKRMP